MIRGENFLPRISRYRLLLHTASISGSFKTKSDMYNNTIPNPHLGLFQIMGKTLRGDPTAVIAELSGWLSNPDSPALWAPFAFSIRGLAYEVMDECDLARMDYIQGLNLYDTLLEELGEEVLQRMTNNMKFMRVRLEALPPTAVSPVESYFEKYAAEAADNNNDTRESTSTHNDAPEPLAEEHMVGEESVYQWEQHEEKHHERPDGQETLNRQEQIWQNWEDDINMETVAVDVTNETGVEGQSGGDSADHAQEEHEEENIAVNGEMAIQITDVQNLEETTSGKVAEEVDVLNILNAGPEVIDMNVDGAQENLDGHDDEATGEQQDASKTGVDPEAEPQHQATD